MQSHFILSLIFFVVNAIPDNPKPGELMKYHMDTACNEDCVPGGKHTLDVNDSKAYVEKHAMNPNHECDVVCDDKPKEPWWCRSSDKVYTYFDGDEICHYDKKNIKASWGDCANFVSQVLRAGGTLKPRLHDYNFENSFAAIKLWDLRAGLHRLGWQKTEHNPCKMPPKGVQVGDVLIYLEEFDNNYADEVLIPGHAVFIVEVDEPNGMVYIAGHTPRVKRAKYITFLKPGRMKCEIWHGREGALKE